MAGFDGPTVARFAILDSPASRYPLNGTVRSESPDAAGLVNLKAPSICRKDKERDHANLHLPVSVYRRVHRGADQTTAGPARGGGTAGHRGRRRDAAGRGV